MALHRHAVSAPRTVKAAGSHTANVRRAMMPVKVIGGSVHLPTSIGPGSSNRSGHKRDFVSAAISERQRTRPGEKIEQSVAIALSKARKKGLKVPRRRRRA